jgi:hypothetical protein
MKGEVSYDPSVKKRDFTVKSELGNIENYKGIVSTCLFGDFCSKKMRETYIEPLLQNAKVLPRELPGWVIRVYIDPTVPDSLVKELLDAGCQVYIMKESTDGFSGTLWRFLPAAGLTPFVTYDTDADMTEDSILLKKLVGTVNDWAFRSPKPFYQRTLATINFFVPISAGLFGSKGGAIPNIQDLMEKYNDTWFGADEAFLTKEVHPLFKKRQVYKIRSPLEYITGVVLVVVVGSIII